MPVVPIFALETSTVIAESASSRTIPTIVPTTTRPVTGVDCVPKLLTNLNMVGMFVLTSVQRLTGVHLMPRNTLLSTITRIL